MFSCSADSFEVVAVAFIECVGLNHDVNTVASPADHNSFMCVCVFFFFLFASVFLYKMYLLYC